jgi:monovalent cation/hydrogen antiporter
MLRALSAERDVLLTGRSNGTYSSRTLTRAQRNLDVEEARLQLIRSAQG